MRDAPRRGPGRRRVSLGFRRVDLRGAFCPGVDFLDLFSDGLLVSLSARAVSLTCSVEGCRYAEGRRR